MPTLADRIIAMLTANPGLSDRELSDALLGAGAPQQAVNQTCRSLESRGRTERRSRPDGRIGNYLKYENPKAPPSVPLPEPATQPAESLSEDRIKDYLRGWLSTQGWETRIAWKHQLGIDIEAVRGGERWIIEVKGQGSRPQMRVNYFLSILGETMQRMDDPNAKYSIALLDISQFRNLWQRLPHLAKPGPA